MYEDAVKKATESLENLEKFSSAVIRAEIGVAIGYAILALAAAIRESYEKHSECNQ